MCNWDRLNRLLLLSHMHMSRPIRSIVKNSTIIFPERCLSLFFFVLLSSLSFDSPEFLSIVVYKANFRVYLQIDFGLWLIDQNCCHSISNSRFCLWCDRFDLFEKA